MEKNIWAEAAKQDAIRDLIAEIDWMAKRDPLLLSFTKKNVIPTVAEYATAYAAKNGKTFDHKDEPPAVFYLREFEKLHDQC